MADPRQLQDCCPFSDGAAAVVVAEDGKARKLNEKTYLGGRPGPGQRRAFIPQKDITRVRARETSTRRPTVRPA